MKFTAIIRQEGQLFSSLCPELDIASQGESPAEAKSNLIEAIELFLEVADKDEITARYSNPPTIESLEVKVG